MSALRLSLACWDYDRTRALADGSVRPDGIELTYLPLPVEETFFRMMRHREFDCAEMSLSSYVASLGAENPPFIAIPVFPSRCFRHSCIFVSAKSGITRPEQLVGKRVGVPEYQQTAREVLAYVLRDLTSPQGGFFSAGSRPDFQKYILIIPGILGQEQELHFLLQGGLLLPQAVELGFGKLPHFFVGFGQQLLACLDFFIHPFVDSIGFD